MSSKVGTISSSKPSSAALIDAIARRIQNGAPCPGPGWRVCVLGASRDSRTFYAFDSYDQVKAFELELSDLGYAMSLLDRRAHGCDFVFSLPSEDGDNLLL